jgi:hypothetical protein
MAALLLVSDKCEYCIQTIDFIKNNPVLIPLVNIHNISKYGLPKELGDVKRVPTLVTSKGQRHTGIEVIRWLETNVPCTFEGTSSCGLTASYDEPFDGIGDGFPLDSYGMELSPSITPSIQTKIDRSTKDAYDELKKTPII